MAAWVDNVLHAAACTYMQVLKGTHHVHSMHATLTAMCHADEHEDLPSQKLLPPELLTSPTTPTGSVAGWKDLTNIDFPYILLERLSFHHETG
jgi:hypothetical protein